MNRKGVNPQSLIYSHLPAKGRPQDGVLVFAHPKPQMAAGDTTVGSRPPQKARPPPTPSGSVPPRLPHLTHQFFSSWKISRTPKPEGWEKRRTRFFPPRRGRFCPPLFCTSQTLSGRRFQGGHGRAGQGRLSAAYCPPFSFRLWSLF